MAYLQPFPLAAPQVQKVQAPSYGPDLSVRLICPECRDPNPEIAEEFGSGDLVCRNCGLVLGDRIVDTRSEWRTFANDEGDDPSRVGAASDPLMEGREQLDTVVSFRDGGSGMLENCNVQPRALRARARSVIFYRVPRYIKLVCTSAPTRRSCYGGNPSMRSLPPASSIACRQAHVPRTFREICNLTHVSTKILGRCCKALERAFNLTPGASATASTPSPSSGPENLLVRYCNHLDLPANVQSICSDIIMGGAQSSIAGGAIFFTSNLLGKTKSLRDISAVAGVSEGTIKLVYRLYYNEKEKLVKKEWIDDGKADLSRLPFESNR
ncbi:hypothetical protein DFH09DRAFT_1217332 [Mycena vulgaris]|nr:hypothetical protein DFH09DRAFT_1217332 [Mycena vulgaris]